jgi:hypothetical protein
MTGETELIKAYLLGDASDDQRRVIEDRFFADDAFFDRVELAEDELVEAYLRDELSSQDRVRFETHFLQSPRRREMTEISQLLERKWQRWPQPQIQPAPAPLRWSAAAVWQRFRPLSPALATIAIVALCGASGGLFVRLQNERQAAAAREAKLAQEGIGAQREIDELNAALQRERAGAKAPASTPAPRAMLAVTLSPGLLRSTDTNPIVVSRGIDAVRVTLQTDLKVPDGFHLVTVKHQNGQEVWRTRWLVISPPSGRIEIILPAHLLVPGRHVIEWAHEDRSGRAHPMEDYLFIVEHQQ